MTTVEMKKQVIGQINQLNDIEVLTDVYKLLNIDKVDLDIYKLSDNHKLAVDMAINQIANGDFLTNDQANKEVDKWLNK